MNAEYINFETPLGEYSIPNRWNLLSAEQFISICELLTWYGSGKISYRELHILYVCRIFALDVKKIKGTTAYENLYLLSSQIDFIFKGNKEINCCFLAQLLPELKAGKETFTAYRIQTEFDTLTCTLTALQFIEAYELLGCTSDKLPLLAAILYYPEKYTSEKAHGFAKCLSKVDPVTLQAIALNFRAFVNYLFTQTHFNILHAKKSTSDTNKMSISMSDSLYNLSSDGLGNVEVIEQMPVIKYLSILRKKLIESIRAMHDSGLNLSEISEKTDLPIKTIKNIV